ncbi:MAG: RES family NAD+ phosphorylase [Pseudomonadota bacterium]
MAKLPNAPDRERLQDLPPSVLSIEAGTLVHRIYRRGGEHPTLWNAFRYFGPASARFDHQERDATGRASEQARGILYLARDIPTALAEVFQEKRTVNRALDRLWLVSLRLACNMTLLNLNDTFCIRAGGSMKLVSGPTVYAQNWSRAFYECYEDIHGLYYPSSLTNRPVIALYERALSLSPFPATPVFHRALNDPLLIEPLRNSCKEIGYDFI